VTALPPGPCWHCYRAQLGRKAPKNKARATSWHGLSATRCHIVQSIAFGYARGGEPHPETDPLDLSDPARAVTIKGAAEMEQQVLASGLDAVILRYGFFYGPGTWHEEPTRKPGLHVDAAAQAALLALTRGAGIYNIADEEGLVSIAKARAELGFDPQVRLQ
jgi:nucleoside-diphosphate-sugar epimerase